MFHLSESGIFALQICPKKFILRKKVKIYSEPKSIKTDVKVPDLQYRLERLQKAWSQLVYLWANFSSLP